MESIFLYKGRNGCVDQGILWLPTVLKQQQLLQLISSNNCENRKDRKLLFTGAQNRLNITFYQNGDDEDDDESFDLGDSETFLEDYVTTLDVEETSIDEFGAFKSVFSCKNNACC